jgi:DNA/RNA endonuclease YhcR with UshA esterase domain
MKVKLAIAVGISILLLIGAAVGWNLYNKPHEGVKNVEADMRMSAADLFNDFQRNENVANKKYLNKVIEVTGIVSEVQNANGSQIILLSSADDMGGVSCQLTNDEHNKKIQIKKSTKITVKGKCSGYLMDVNLVDCVLVK